MSPGRVVGVALFALIGRRGMGQRRERQWSVWHCCLVLLGRLLRGPGTRRELVAAVCAAMGDETYSENPLTGRISALEKDLSQRLPGLGIQVGFDRSRGVYELRDFAALPGFDLPDEALAALAFLEDTFQPGTPHFEQVHVLLDRLGAYLPEERRRVLERQRVALRVDLRQLDKDVITPAVARAVERARSQRRLLRFWYRSPSQADGVPVLPTVEPYER